MKTGDNIFGTDGLRGPAQLLETTPGLVNEETFYGLAAEHYAMLRDSGSEGPVVVGRDSDTRTGSYGLKRAVVAGFQSEGAEVVDLDVAPTPVVLKSAQCLGAMAAGVVTASHNVASDNGLKLTIGSDKPDAAYTSRLSQRFWERAESGIVLPRQRDKRVYLERTAQYEAYKAAVLQDLRESAGAEQPLAGKVILVDGAFGAAQYLTPALFEALGATVERFACGDDGVINEDCGAADLSGLKNYLQTRPDLLRNPNFLGAVANDGDADRMMAMGVVWQDGQPEVVELNGNYSMYVASDGQPGIVGTDYTNSGLVTRLRDEGIGFEYCDNGDTNVTLALREKQARGHTWTRGGEFSGHTVDTNWLSSGDGIRTALHMAVWAAQREMNFGELYQTLPLWHESMRKIKLGQIAGRILHADEAVQAIREVVSDRLGVDGRIHMRPSGTEPVYRVWGEAISPEDLDKALDDIEAVVSQRACASV